MKITVVSGEKSVVVQVKGSSPEQMKEAESIATRLLAVEGPATPAKPPIGFTAVSTDTEVSADGDDCAE